MWLLLLHVVASFFLVLTTVLLMIIVITLCVFQSIFVGLTVVEALLGGTGITQLVGVASLEDNHFFCKW